MVTPFPQMVVSQALFNLVGGERYDQVSDQVIRYVLGGSAGPPAPSTTDVLDRILDRDRAREIAAEPPPLPPAELRRRFRTSRERRGVPAARAHAGRAGRRDGRRRARRRGTTTPSCAGVLALLCGLAGRPSIPDLTVTPSLRLPAHPCGRAHDGTDRLRAARGFVLDMDGTLVLGDAGQRRLPPLPGAVELTALLADRGVPYVVFTNGSAKSPG